MKITEEQRQLFINWLNNYWGEKKCPICSANNWNISNQVMELREFHSGSMVVGGPVQPLMPVICSQCGYTLLFNAIKVGIIPLGN